MVSLGVSAAGVVGGAVVSVGASSSAAGTVVSSSAVAVSSGAGSSRTAPADSASAFSEREVLSLFEVCAAVRESVLEVFSTAERSLAAAVVQDDEVVESASVGSALAMP